MLIMLLMKTNISDIISSKSLKTHKPSFGTDQDSWPDGSTEKRSYFTHDPKIARNFYPEEGTPVLLRIKRESALLKKEKVTGDLYSQKNIPHKHFERYTGNGQWKSLLNT